MLAVVKWYIEKESFFEVLKGAKFFILGSRVQYILYGYCDSVMSETSNPILILVL